MDLSVYVHKRRRAVGHDMGSLCFRLGNMVICGIFSSNVFMAVVHATAVIIAKSVFDYFLLMFGYCSTQN